MVDEQGWRVFRWVSVPFSLPVRPFGVGLQIYFPIVDQSVCSWLQRTMLLLSFAAVFISKCVMESVWLRPHTSNSFKTSQTSSSTFVCLPPFLANHCHNTAGLTLLLLAYWAEASLAFTNLNWITLKLFRLTVLSLNASFKFNLKLTTQPEMQVLSSQEPLDTDCLPLQLIWCGKTAT